MKKIITLIIVFIYCFVNSSNSYAEAIKIDETNIYSLSIKSDKESFIYSIKRTSERTENGTIFNETTVLVGMGMFVLNSLIIQWLNNTFNNNHFDNILINFISLILTIDMFLGSILIIPIVYIYLKGSSLFENINKNSGLSWLAFLLAGICIILYFFGLYIMSNWVLLHIELLQKSIEKYLITLENHLDRIAIVDNSLNINIMKFNF